MLPLLLSILISFNVCRAAYSAEARIGDSQYIPFNESRKLHSLDSNHLFDVWIEAELRDCVFVRLPYVGKSHLDFDSHSGKTYQDGWTKANFFPKFFDSVTRRVQEYDSIYVCNNAGDYQRCDGVKVTYDITKRTSNNKVFWENFRVFVDATLSVEIVLVVIVSFFLLALVIVFVAGVVYCCRRRKAARKMKERIKKANRRAFRRMACYDSTTTSACSFDTDHPQLRRNKKSISLSPSHRMNSRRMSRRRGGKGVQNRQVVSISNTMSSTSTSFFHKPGAVNSPSASSARKQIEQTRQHLNNMREVLVMLIQQTKHDHQQQGTGEGLNDHHNSEPMECGVDVFHGFLRCHFTGGEFEPPDSMLVIDLSTCSTSRTNQSDNFVTIEVVGTKGGGKSSNNKPVMFHGERIDLVKIFLDSNDEAVRMKGMVDDGIKVGEEKRRREMRRYPMLHYCVKSFRYFVVDCKNEIKTAVLLSLSKNSRDEQAYALMKLTTGRILEFLVKDHDPFSVYVDPLTEMTFFSEGSSAHANNFTLQLHFPHNSAVFGKVLEIGFLNKPSHSRWSFLFSKMLGLKCNRRNDDEERARKFEKQVKEEKKLFDLSYSNLQKLKITNPHLRKKYWRVHEYLLRITTILTGEKFKSSDLCSLRREVGKWTEQLDSSEHFLSIPVKILVVDQDQKSKMAVKLVKKELLGRIVQMLFREMDSTDHLSLCFKNLRIDWGAHEIFRMRDIDPETSNFSTDYQPHLMYDVDCVCLKAEEFIDWCFMLAVTLVELEQTMIYQIYPNESFKIATSMTPNKGMSCQDAVKFVMQSMSIDPSLYPTKVKQFLRGTMNRTDRKKELIVMMKEKCEKGQRSKPFRFETHEDIEKFIEELKVFNKWFFYEAHEDVLLLKAFDRVLHIEKKNLLRGRTCFFNSLDEYLEGLFLNDKEFVL